MPAQATSCWIVLDNYDMASRQPACSITSTIKRPDDIGVFRPALAVGWVDQEGAFDISQLALEEAARLLGWRSPDEVKDEVDTYRDRANRANLAKAQQVKKINRLEAEVSELMGELGRTA